MADNVIPEILMAFEGLDRSAGLVMKALRDVQREHGDEEYARQTTAFSMGLALRLVTFSLGPAAAIKPETVAPTALDILGVLHDLQSDLTPPPGPGGLAS